MQFPDRDFSLQYVSCSYQNIVQNYDNYDDYVYLLDGNGYVILCVLSASLGYPIITQNQTVSSSLFAVSASYSQTSENFISTSYSKYSDTASYVSGSPHVEKGIVSGSIFSNSPLSLQISYDNTFDDNNYIISIIGEDARIWTAYNRTTSSFTISSNSSQPLLGMVMWRVEQD
jgi:hypothetical protein